MNARRIAVFAAMALLVTCGARAGTVTVTGPATGTPGGTVTVAVTLSPDLNNVYALQGALSYDPAVLTPLPSQEGSAAQGFYAGALAPFPGETIPKDADLFRMNPSVAGTIVFGYVKNPSNPSGSSTTVVPTPALRVTFDVAAAAAGTTSVQLIPYTVNGQSMPELVLGAMDGSPLEASAGPPLTINFRKAGDVNSDGVVNLDDVSLALQLAAGAPPTGVGTVSAGNGDVWPAASPDGKVTLQDAARILRFVNGLEAALG